MITNRTILITGGAGFIGINLLKRLIKHNKVIIFDNFNNFYEGKELRLLKIIGYHKNQSKVRVISLDLCNYSNFNFIGEPIDIIIHLAAYANVRYSVDNPWLVMSNNFSGTLNILRYMIEHSIKRLIFTSSSAVYGNPVNIPIPENHIIHPISPYGICKWMEESLFKSFYDMFKNYITILRLSTVYGTYGREDMAINGFLDKIIKGERLTIYGNGSQIRDYVYIDDVIDAILLSLKKDKSKGQIFNIGSGQSVSVRDLLLKISNITPDIPLVDYKPKNIGDVEDTTYKISKAIHVLTYSPKINIDNGLSKTYSWIKNKY